MKELTIIYEVQITHVEKHGNKVSFVISEEYKRDIEKFIKARLNADDVQIMAFKVFERNNV